MPVQTQQLILAEPLAENAEWVHESSAQVRIDQSNIEQFSHETIHFDN